MRKASPQDVFHRQLKYALISAWISTQLGEVSCGELVR
jgi:hypothetical protein